MMAMLFAASNSWWRQQWRLLRLCHIVQAHSLPCARARDPCAEGAARRCGRRVVQIDVVTSEVHVEMSQYVKRELHSLVNYLHSSLVDEELTSSLSRHFIKRARPAPFCPCCLCPIPPLLYPAGVGCS